MGATDDPSGSSSDIRSRHRDAAADVLDQDTYAHYVGGEWVSAAEGDTFTTTDPTTGEPLAEAQAGTAPDVDRAVTAAREAFDGGWGDTHPDERQRVLTEMADAVEANHERLATIEVLDNGKPITEAMGDIAMVADYFRYFAAAARTATGEQLPTSDVFDRDKHITAVHEPYGVVGQITPWNFPLLMAAWKLGPALAAGNCAVLKPSEETPLSTLEFCSLVDDVVPDGVVNVVTGYGPEAGEPLTRHEDVDKLAFTGSTAVGKEIARTAADTVTPTTLELGGKSPVIIHEDADVEQAVEVTMMAIFFNTGECCAAGSRIFVHEAVEEAFVNAFAGAAESLEVGDPLLESTDLGPKISEQQVERTMSYVREARDAGAEILTGGGTPDDEDLADGAFVQPTIIGDIDHDNDAVQEEVFGPVEELFTWSDYDEMISLANDVDYGLASGVVSNDIDRAYRTAEDLEAGVVWINHYNDVPPGMPFGGYKESGYGRENALETLAEYTRTKAISVNRGPK
jgi:aldehyde dehydrogenase (NAD+)